MRFLLHRQQPAVMAARRLQKEVVNASATASSITSANGDVPTNDQPQGGSMRRAWGQQCSPNCGCVVRFEATINDESKRIESLTYHAKTLVTKKMKNAATASSPTEHQTPELQVVLTSKGRPMTKACECTAIHQLCHSIIDNVQNSSLSSVKNMLEFHSHRSSTAFARTALLAQELSPTKQQHCFDVVEEALTAVVKGHIPKPRRQQVAAPPQPTRKHEVPDYNWPPSHEQEDDEDESFPSFSPPPPPGQESTSQKDQNEAMRTSHVGQFFFWNKDNHDGDYGYEEVVDNESTRREVKAAASSDLRNLSSSSSPFSSPVKQQEGPSTLQMFDLNLIKEEEEKKKSRMNLSSQDKKNRKLDLAMRPPPRDWVSYVDEQLYHQEQHMRGRGKAQEASA